MKIIKGLFFDMDGTLVDTLEANIQAYQQAAKKHGRNLKREDFNYGKRSDEFLRDAFEGITEEEITAIREAKAEVYGDYLHLVKPNKYLIDFMSAMHPRDVKRVLVTTAHSKNAKNVLQVLGLENTFDHVVTGDMVQKPKPSPEAYLLALQTAGIEADEAIAFEDTEVGSSAALAAGIRTIIIQTPSDED